MLYVPSLLPAHFHSRPPEWLYRSLAPMLDRSLTRARLSFHSTDLHHHLSFLYSVLILGGRHQWQLWNINLFPSRRMSWTQKRTRLGNWGTGMLWTSILSTRHSIRCRARPPMVPLLNQLIALLRCQFWGVSRLMTCRPFLLILGTV